MRFIYFLQDGHLGVNIFFVISGFLITSLMLREETQTNVISLKNFYIRRTLRIFPAYYFLLIVYFILQLIGYIHIAGSSWLTAITYTKYFNWHDEWYTSHAWSLSIEEHFYILWPLIFVAAPKLRKVMAFALIMLVPIIRIYVEYYPVSWINELTIFMRIDAIATGCLFALYKDSIIELLRKQWTIIFYVSLLILFFIGDIYFYAQQVNLGFIFIPLGFTHGTIANILIGIIMMHAIFAPPKLWHKFLNWKPINYIGLLSYGIYLWQQIFVCGDVWVTRFPQDILFILAAAMFSYHIIERPFLKLKDRFIVSKPHS